jgi:glutathione synthase/RimK-type ligase-like ATP-grasp enzyme
MKPLQLAEFADADLPIPATCSTNDPDAVRAFLDRVGDAVYKPVSGGGHARAIDADSLDDDRLQRLSNSPVQFQERLDGDNLRLYVVDGDVVAAGRIVSDELDYRMGEHEVERVDPRAEIVETAVDAADVLDLPFAGVDIIDEGDRFALLEVNPSPMFATFDELAGTDVAGPLADLLLQ